MAKLTSRSYNSRLNTILDQTYQNKQQYALFTREKIVIAARSLLFHNKSPEGRKNHESPATQALQERRKTQTFSAILDVRRAGSFPLEHAEIVRDMRIQLLIRAVMAQEGKTSEGSVRTRRKTLMYLEEELFDNYTYEEGSNHSWSEEEWGEECHPIHIFLDFFHTYYIPLIIFVGLVGNLLSCVVFLTTHLKMRSSSYYLAALSSADFGFLSVLLLVYLSNNAGLELFNKQGWCQGLVYVSSVCSILSVWLIVAFTVERFIAVQYPLQRPHMCTVSRAKFIVLALTAVAMVSQSYSFVTAGMVTSANGSQICEMLEEYHDTMRIINIIDTLVTLIGPFILIVVMNTMIARNLLLFRKRFQHGSLDECLYSGSEMNQINTQVRIKEKVLLLVGTS